MFFTPLTLTRTRALAQFAPYSPSACMAQPLFLAMNGNAQ